MRSQASSVPLEERPPLQGLAHRKNDYQAPPSIPCLCCLGSKLASSSWEMLERLSAIVGSEQDRDR